MAKDPVAIIGGGIAGIASALKLIELGEKVILLEKKATLGGRATSFPDPICGDEIDNGQHVLLGCCTNVIDLLSGLGQEQEITWSDSFTYILPDGSRHQFAPNFLPAPLHFSQALLTFGPLKLRERLEVARAFLAMMLSTRKKLNYWVDKTIGDWLQSHGQSQGTIARFWRPIVIGAVNESLEVAACNPALQVFLEGFLPHRSAARLGVAKVGLHKLYALPAHEKIVNSGSEVRTRAKVKFVTRGPGGVEGLTLNDGQKIKCKRMVVALPPESLCLLRDQDGHGLVDEAFLNSFSHAPIAGIHLWFDREIMDINHGALLDTELEWMFKKEKPGPKALALGARERIQGVISAAHHLAGRSQKSVLEHALGEIHRALPKSRGAKLIRGLVVRENRATLSLDPKSEHARPSQLTDLDGCVLAGDWVQTGWPGTLEGAVRSGRTAAALMTGRSRRDVLTPDLPRGFFSKILLACVPRPITLATGKSLRSR